MGILLNFYSRVRTKIGHNFFVSSFKLKRRFAGAFFEVKMGVWIWLIDTRHRRHSIGSCSIIERKEEKKLKKWPPPRGITMAPNGPLLLSTRLAAHPTGRLVGRRSPDIFFGPPNLPPMRKRRLGHHNSESSQRKKPLILIL